MIISFYLHVFISFTSLFSSNCLKGYHDYNCGLKCQYLKYGDRCGDKCQCRPRYCDHVYGCPPQGKKNTHIKGCIVNYTHSINLFPMN